MQIFLDDCLVLFLSFLAYDVGTPSRRRSVAGPLLRWPFIFLQWPNHLPSSFVHMAHDELEFVGQNDLENLITLS